MKLDVQALQVRNNQAKNRFEVALGDTFGIIEYEKQGSVYVMTHTEVPKEFVAQGVADHLAHEALEQVKAEGAQVVPECPFVNAYIRRHSEYQSLVTSRPGNENV